MYKSKKAFTNIELLVVLLIVALLIGIMTYAIMVVRRNQRNTERRAILKDLVMEIGVIQSSQLRNPDSIAVYDPGGGEGYEYTYDCQLSFYMGNIELGDIYHIPNYYCEELINYSCLDFEGEELETNKLSFCFDNNVNQIGLKLENSDIPFFIDF